MIWLSEHPRLFGVALGLIMGLAGGYAARGKPPDPAVALHEATASEKAVAARKDELDKKGAEHEVTRNFAPPAPGCPRGRPVLVSETVTDRGPEVVETHASEQTRETAQTHTDLTVTPPPPRFEPTRAFQFGFEDVLGNRDVRLALRDGLRVPLIGLPIEAEVSFVPARGFLHGWGVGAAFKF